jgi:hypothetical protein
MSKARVMALSVLLAAFVGTVGTLATVRTNTPTAETTTQCVVYFNTKSFKYHNPSCQWAKKCTVNCITLPLDEAKERGGVPCKVCRGVCRKVKVDDE